MSRNRGRDTKPEVLLRKACWALGMRYTLNAKLPGKPDFVFPRSGVAVFVDGCFWRGCPIHYQAPATRSKFWEAKFLRNRARDKLVVKLLHDAGWKPMRIWEHTVRSDLLGAVEKIRAMVLSSAIRVTDKERAELSKRKRKRPRRPRGA